MSLSSALIICFFFIVLLSVNVGTSYAANSQATLRSTNPVKGGSNRDLKSDDYYNDPTVQPTTKSQWKTTAPTVKIKTCKPTVQPTSYPSYQGGGGNADITDISDNIIKDDDDDGNAKSSSSSTRLRLYIVIAALIVTSLSVFGYVYYQQTKVSQYSLETVWSKRDAAAQQAMTYSSVSHDETDDLRR